MKTFKTALFLCAVCAASILTSCKKESKPTAASISESVTSTVKKAKEDAAPVVEKAKEDTKKATEDAKKALNNVGK